MRRAVDTTIAPALTATIVILAGIYLISLDLTVQRATRSGAYAGASFAWKVWGPITFAMLNAAETRELPDTWNAQLLFSVIGGIGIYTFIVYPLKFAPVQAKISANGATVYFS